MVLYEIDCISKYDININMNKIPHAFISDTHLYLPLETIKPELCYINVTIDIYTLILIAQHAHT